MSENPDRPEGSGGERPPGAPSAADDILQGLGFLARAARKVVAELDPARVEELARKAAESPVAREVGRRASEMPDKLEALVGSAVDTFNKEGPSGLAQRASRALDPNNVEKVAGSAGKELLEVVERLASRVEDAARATRSEFLKNAAGPPGEAPPPAEGAAASSAAPSPAAAAAPPTAAPAASAAPPAVAPSPAAPPLADEPASPRDSRFRVEE